ncbi:transposase [Bradyrhizobium sp. i1.15.2]|uniref:transposase n=1 Tax=Bradyrhizobium sp. i1.15.2 TaxID=3156362 RepID=UPI003390FF0F
MFGRTSGFGQGKRNGLPTKLGSIIDHTNFPMQASQLIGLSHQYCGQVGKRANCQVAVSLSVAISMRICRWPTGCIFQKDLGE